MAEYAEKTLSVNLAQGLHVRPARRVVACAAQFQADVYLGHRGEKATAKSALDLFRLEILGDCQVTVTATGVDAVQAVAAMCAVLRELEAESQRDT